MIFSDHHNEDEDIELIVAKDMNLKFDKVLKNLDTLKNQNMSMFRELFPYENISSPEKVNESSPSFVRDKIESPVQRSIDDI